MLKNRRTLSVAMAILLAIGVSAGFLAGRYSSSNAMAEDASSVNVDRQTLEQLYEAVYGRPLDEGASFHVGKSLKQVLKDITNSNERKYYSALFKAVKAYEEAVRAPGDLSATDKQNYLNAIDSALSTLIAWVETLPDQPICKGVVGPEQARQSIKDAYEKMDAASRQKAEHGLFNAYTKIGPPDRLTLPAMRCLTRSPSPSPSASSSPSPSPSASSSPSPSPSPN